MKKPHPPYVGVTGITSPKEVKEILRIIPEGLQRKIFLGTLVSQMTLEGKKNNIPSRYPDMSILSDILVRDERVAHIIHFSPGQQELSIESLRKIVRLGKGNIDGIQLNMLWPNPVILSAFRKEYPSIKIILQVEFIEDIQKKRQRTVGNIANHASRYIGIVDYLLLDSSLGRHIPLNPNVVFPYVRYFSRNEHAFHMHISVAGGLSAKRIKALKPLLSEHPNLSFDAESALRSSSLDVLSIGEVRRYLKRAAQLL